MTCTLKRMPLLTLNQSDFYITVGLIKFSYFQCREIGNCITLLTGRLIRIV